MEYILIVISALLVNNIVLAQFLGVCPFLGVSNKVNTALGMAAAVTFVIVLATIATYLIQVYVLNKLGIAFMQTITFILVIAALVQMVEIVLKKISKPLYQALGIFLPLITTNCAVLGVAILVFKATTIASRAFIRSRICWSRSRPSACRSCSNRRSTASRRAAPRCSSAPSRRGSRSR